jgi:hypothetical protein
MNKVVDDDFICSLCVDCRHCMYRDDRRRWSNNIGGPCQFCLHEVGNYNTTQTMVYQANEAKKLTKHGNFSTGGSLLGHKMPTVTMAVPVNTIKNCIVCDKEHSLTTNHMVRCDVCECWVHETCDKNLMNNSKKLNYSCPKCIRMFSIKAATATSLSSMVKAIQSTSIEFQNAKKNESSSSSSSGGGGGSNFLDGLVIGSASETSRRITKGDIVVVKRKTEISPAPFLPYCGALRNDWCKAIQYNHGLHTQCTLLPEIGSPFCVECEKSYRAHQLGSTTSTYLGRMEERIDHGVLDYVDIHGRKTIPFYEVVHKLKIKPLWDLWKKQSLALFGVCIPRVHIGKNDVIHQTTVSKIKKMNAVCCYLPMTKNKIDRKMVSQHRVKVQSWHCKLCKRRLTFSAKFKVTFHYEIEERLSPATSMNTYVNARVLSVRGNKALVDLNSSENESNEVVVSLADCIKLVERRSDDDICSNSRNVTNTFIGSVHASRRADSGLASMIVRPLRGWKSKIGLNNFIDYRIQVIPHVVVCCG